MTQTKNDLAEQNQDLLFQASQNALKINEMQRRLNQLYDVALTMRQLVDWHTRTHGGRPTEGCWKHAYEAMGEAAPDVPLVPSPGPWWATSWMHAADRAVIQVMSKERVVCFLACDREDIVDKGRQCVADSRALVCVPDLIKLAEEAVRLPEITGSFVGQHIALVRDLARSVLATIHTQQ